jgi:hypothetical protein
VDTDSDSMTSNSGGGSEGDVSGVVIASILGLLSFVAVIVGASFYRKHSRSNHEHVPLPDTNIELSKTTHGQGKQSSDGSALMMECINPKFNQAGGNKLFWRMHETEKGDKYYEDTESGRTTWTARDSSGVALT